MVPKVIAADNGLSYMKGNLGPKIVAPHLDLNSWDLFIVKYGLNM